MVAWEVGAMSAGRAHQWLDEPINDRMAAGLPSTLVAFSRRPSSIAADGSILSNVRTAAPL